MGGSLDDDIGTIEELATRLGSKAAATGLLRDLGVPVRHGVFSRRLLIEALEDPIAEQKGGPPEALATLGGVLRPLGVRIIDYRIGRPTIVQIIAGNLTRRFGFEPSSEPLLAPVIISSSEPVAARVYATERRVQTKAAFTITGFLEEPPVPLYLCVLHSERRAWGLTAGELRFIYEELPKIAKRRKKKKGTDLLANQFVRLKNRPGVLRASFPFAPSDWDLEARLDLGAG